MEKSAKYYDEHLLFDHVNGNVFLSRQDNYADCILTNIIYSIDNKDLIRSVISASYYNPEGENVNKSFSSAVLNGAEPNVDYSRYWHGSMVLLRPLFIAFDIVSIRVILGVFVLAMTIWFEYLLVKKSYTLFGVCYGIALLLVSSWMIAFCVEYAMTFVVLSVELPILFMFLENDRPESCLYSVIVCSAIVTAFVDFLTTETITFTMAYLLYLIVKEKKHRIGQFKTEFMSFFMCGLSWGLSYASMMGLKWIIALSVLGKDVFISDIQKAAFRINGDSTIGNIKGAEVVSNYERVTGAFWRNIGCLIPFKDIFSIRTTMVVGVISIFVIFAIWYLFRDENNYKMEKCILCVAIIPYIRFIVINNHSYIHFFFTYRAQLVTVTAVMYICLNNINSFVASGKR